MKKNIKWLCYLEIIIFLIVILIVFLIDYQNLLEHKTDMLEKARSYNILDRGRNISFSQEIEKRKELEGQLFEKYNVTNISDIDVKLDSLNDVNEVLQEQVNQLEKENADLALKKDNLSNQYSTLKKQKE